MSDYLLMGEATGSAADLHRALARALACQDVTPGAASVLITLTQDAERAMADATEFADAQPDGDPDRGVVILLPPAATAAWPDVRYGATVWAFVRYAALAWAPRRVRINLISLGIDLVQPWSKPRGARQPVPDQDVIAAIRAIRGWPCMTGQSICLGA